MIRYIIRRILAGILVLVAASFLTFFIFQLGPKFAHTSPALFYVGKIPPDQATLKLIEHRYGIRVQVASRREVRQGGVRFFVTILERSPGPLAVPPVSGRTR